MHDPKKPLAQEPQGSAALRDACVVLVRTQGPVNLGLVARLCGNLGVTDLRLVAPQCEVNCPDSRKFSTHSKELMLAAPVFADLGAAVADCGLAIGTSARVRDAVGNPPVLPEALSGVLTARPVGRWALVFGNEADGLSEDELAHCQACVQLRTFGPNYSYNLSHAVAILLYHVAAMSPPARLPDQPDGADRVLIDHLLAYWLHTLDRFAYFRRTDRERFAPQLRRLVNRLHLSTHDVQMLMGMFAQFHYQKFGDRADGPQWQEVARGLGEERVPDPGGPP